MTPLRPCPLCDYRAVEVIHRQSFLQPTGSPLPGVYDVVACPGCGLVYADTPADQAVYDRYYQAFSKYEDPAVASGSGAEPLDARRLEQTADEMARRLGPDARILDIGCAGGGLLVALRNLGFSRLHGIDAAPGCAAAVKALGFESTCLPLSRLSELTDIAPFDCIVLSHVLEHVVDLSALMSTVVALTAAGGRVYLETPNAARYADYPQVPYYYFDSEHINHFDARQLTILGARYGLNEESTGERILEVAPGKRYPAAWAWLRKGPVVPERAFPVNPELAAAVRRYVGACAATPDFQTLHRLAEQQTPVIVWGAGSFAQRLFGLGAIDGCRIVAIVDRDRNKQGLSFAGHQVESPETALASHPSATVLILAAMHSDAIVREIRTMSHGGPVATLETLSPELTESRINP